MPVSTYTCNYYNSNSTVSIFTDVNSTSAISGCPLNEVDTSLEITVSFPIYVIAIFTFIGWFPLMIFLGVGLTALPLDLINDFRFRPRPMDENEFKRSKHELAKKVEVLLLNGRKLLEEKIAADKKSGCGAWR